MNTTVGITEEVYKYGFYILRNGVLLKNRVSTIPAFRNMAIDGDILVEVLDTFNVKPKAKVEKIVLDFNKKNVIINSTEETYSYLDKVFVKDTPKQIEMNFALSKEIFNLIETMRKLCDNVEIVGNPFQYCTDVKEW